MYFFILHLSIADILTAFFTLLPEFAWTFTFPKFYGGDAVCKVVKFLQIVGPYLSSYTLVMTAVDRYNVSTRFFYWGMAWHSGGVRSSDTYRVQIRLLEKLTPPHYFENLPF